MAKEIYLWNKDHNNSVRASKLKEIGIYRTGAVMSREYAEKYPFRVLGWYSGEEEYFEFGPFETEDAARVFITSLHNQIGRG